MVRERLRRLLTLRDKMEHIQQEYVRIREMASGLSAIRYDKDKVQTSNMPDLSDAIKELEDVARKLAKVYREYSVEEFQVNMMLRRLNNHNEYLALYERFIKGRSVNDIADNFNGKEVTPEHIRRLISRGIKNLEKL